MKKIVISIVFVALIAVIVIVYASTRPQTSNQSMSSLPPVVVKYKQVHKTIGRAAFPAIGQPSTTIELDLELPSDSTEKLISNSNQAPFSQLEISGSGYQLIFQVQTDSVNGGSNMPSAKTIYNYNLKEKSQKIDRLTFDDSNRIDTNWTYNSFYNTLVGDNSKGECGGAYGKPYCGTSGIVDYFLGVICLTTNTSDTTIGVCDHAVETMKVTTTITQ